MTTTVRTEVCFETEENGKRKPVLNQKQVEGIAAILNIEVYDLIDNQFGGYDCHVPAQLTENPQGVICKTFLVECDGMHYHITM